MWLRPFTPAPCPLRRSNGLMVVAAAQGAFFDPTLTPRVKQGSLKTFVIIGVTLAFTVVASITLPKAKKDGKGA